MGLPIDPVRQQLSNSISKKLFRSLLGEVITTFIHPVYAVAGSRENHWN